MSYTLVLVGGTGQRFGLALGYLNLLGIASMPDRVVIVDAEGATSQNQLTATTERLLRFGQPGFQPTRILPYPETGGGAATLARCVDHAGSELFPLCYDPKEAERRIDEGFYAVPKTAALVFRSLMRSKKKLFGDELTGGVAAASTQRRVFVAGSVVGGTGAGILRELAECYRQANNYVAGIIFGRFFDIASGEPTTADLERNGRQGCDYLLNRDPHSPFHVMAMVGPPPDAPLPPPTESKSALPHNFPGFLAALSLITDGGDAFIADTTAKEDVKNADKDARIRRAVAFGARGEGAQLHDTDVWFPVRGASGKASYVSLADAVDAAAEARRRLHEWSLVPLPLAYAAGSLFVERKLSRRVAGTLRTLSEAGKINPRTADQLWEKLAGPDGAIAEATRGLESFEEWVRNLVSVKSLQRREASSAELTPRSWREALNGENQRERVNAKEHLEALAQAWCISVASAQWKRSERGKKEGSGGRWLLPYAHPCSLAPGAYGPLNTEVKMNEVDAKSYPTPLGQAQAFAKRLEQQQAEALHDAETLWLALSAGWLELELRDLASSSAVFDQLVADIEKPARFTAVLRVRRGDPFMPRSLASLAGVVIGATHGSCGLWPGIRDEHRAALKQLHDALSPEIRDRARQVLRRWKEAVAGMVAATEPAWWKVVVALTRDAGPAMDWHHLRTRGPLVLEHGDKQTPLYLFTYEPDRATRCNRVLAALSSGQSLDGDEIRSQGRLLARLRRRHAHDDADRFDRDATLRLGYLDLDCELFDVTALAAADQPALDTLRARLQPPGSLFEAWPKEEGDPCSPLSPDLLWRRTSTAPPVYFDVKVRPAGSGFVRFSDVHHGAPEVPGIAFHPGRGKWVVWLGDSLIHAELPSELVADSLVRVTTGGRTCLLRFPPGSVIQSPRAILTTQGHRLTSATGAVWPALPVRRDDLDLVMCDDRLAPAELHADSARFRFRLFGDVALSLSLRTDQFVEEDKLHIELWPNLPQRAWKRFWLGVEADSAPPPYEYALYQRSPHGYYEKQEAKFGAPGEPASLTRYVSVRGRPRLLWMGLAGKGAGFIAFPDEGSPPASVGSSREATLAVDFGTFRTALLVAVPANQKDMPWPELVKHLPGRRLKLVDHEAAAALSREDKSLLPPTQGPASARETGGAVATLFSSAVVYPGGANLGPESIPFQDFSIALSRAQKLREFPGAEERRAAPGKSGLKWNDDPKTVAIRDGYLKAILLLGAVEAFACGATELRIRHSFPLAYDSRESLDQAFERAAAWLREDVLEAGPDASVRLEKPDSESSAGMKAAEAFGEWCVTLDLGGGTLDLGLFRHSAERARAEPVAWDSVKLGGDLVYSSSKDEQELRWKILSNTFTWNSEPHAAHADRLIRLAMEYAARVIAGAMLNQQLPKQGVEVTAVLLGAGWRWHRCFTPQQERFDAEGFERIYGEFLTRRIAKLAPGAVRRVAINSSLLAEGREKLAVVCGLARTSAEHGEVRDSVHAPNGLEESGRAWTEMVHRSALLGAPSALLARPEFPSDLESIAKLNATFERAEVPQAILTRLSKVTHAVTKFRNRTALGLTYEYLTTQWFQR